MGKGECDAKEVSLPTFEWDEIKKHTSTDDRWIVVDGNIYDVTHFQKQHPGGARIIGHFAGEDATVYFINNIIIMDIQILKYYVYYM